MRSKSYQELSKIENFEDRIAYLQTNNRVGEETFGSHRRINQILYHDYTWKHIRDLVIQRDSDGKNVYDLGHPDVIIVGNVYVHHINPITVEDVIERRSCVFDLNNLISVSFVTHNAIHYRRSSSKEREIFSNHSLFERRPNDTCPWR